MKVKSNDRNKPLKIKLSGVIGVLEKLVDFFDIELFGDLHTNLEVFIFTHDGKCITKTIVLFDLQLVAYRKFMFV